MTTVYVGFKFSQMGQHSGYDLIKSYAGYSVILDCQAGRDRLRRFLDSGSLLSRVYAKLFGARLWWVEWQCLLLALRKRHLVFHFVYAESIYRYLGWFRWLGFKVVCTYHQPLSVLESHPTLASGMRRADDVIVLSPEAVEGFRALRRGGVHYVPHGVDTDFFAPDPTVPVRRRVLMVGDWLRDFDFAARAFAQLLETDAEVSVDVVASQANVARLPSHARLRGHSGVSDERLRDLYRSAALVFLPLSGFVANNAVLEAAAVGCRIVIASDQPEDGALPPALVDRIPLDVARATATIVDLIDRPDGGANKRREWVVKRFGWKVVGGATRNVLLG